MKRETGTRIALYVVLAETLEKPKMMAIILFSGGNFSDRRRHKCACVWTLHRNGSIHIESFQKDLEQHLFIREPHLSGENVVLRTFNL